MLLTITQLRKTLLIEDWPLKLKEMTEADVWVVTVIDILISSVMSAGDL